MIRELTSKYHDDFYCLNCLHSFTTEKEIESHKKVRKNKDFCKAMIPFKDTTILKCNQYQKFWLSTIYCLCKSWMFNRKEWWM